MKHISIHDQDVGTGQFNECFDEYEVYMSLYVKGIMLIRSFTPSEVKNMRLNS